MEFNSEKPIYLQIADFICKNILQQKWNEGDKIPSIRDIAVQLEVNPNTVMRTYSLLQDNQIIFNKRGIGYHIAIGGYNKTKEMKQKHFFEQELPLFFKNIDLLGISINEIFDYYKNK
jgi:GntR family transcriptional regulator